MLQTSIITSQTQCQTTPMSSIDTIVHFIRVCTHDCWHVCIKMPTAAKSFGWSHASFCHSVWKCWMSSERSQHLFLHPSLCFFFLKILKEKRMRNLSAQHFLSLRLFFCIELLMIKHRIKVTWQEDDHLDVFTVLKWKLLQNAALAEKDAAIWTGSTRNDGVDSVLFQSTGCHLCNKNQKGSKSCYLESNNLFHYI